MNAAIAPVDVLELWHQYQLTHSSKIKNELILHYTWVVRYVLQKSSLPVSSLLTEDDFFSIGILGLNEAIERYDIERGVKFESYAIPRIRGTIQDELRKLDWLSRSTRKKAQDFMNAKEQVSVEHGREATVDEIIERLQIEPDKYQKYLNAAASARSFLSMSDSNFYVNSDEELINVLEEIPEDAEDNFLNIAIENEKTNFLVNYLEGLDSKRRLVMVLYYYEDRTFKEIGNDLGISESRVCQIHTQVINDLKEKFKKFEK